MFVGKFVETMFGWRNFELVNVIKACCDKSSYLNS